MLYKVTPMLTPVEPKKKAAADPNAPKEARKRRKSAVFDAEGNEVLITMMCLKCRQMKPLGMFGLRKMADGAIRNQPWCRTCRSGAGTKKKPEAEVETEVVAEPVAVAAPAPQPEVEKDEATRNLEALLAGPPPA
ncbi:MAG: hypothetical protein ACOZQL_34010 [Myxococcota bacterium]